MCVCSEPQEEQKGGGRWRGWPAATRPSGHRQGGGETTPSQPQVVQTAEKTLGEVRPALTQGAGAETRAETRAAQALVQLVLDRLEEAATRLLEESVKLLSGERLAREVAAFYRGLLEAGVPEDLARRLTERYLEKLLSMASPVSEILAAAMGSGRERVRIVTLQGLKEAAEAYREIEAAGPGGEG